MIDVRNHNFVILEPQPVEVELAGEKKWRWNPKHGGTRSHLWPRVCVGVIAKGVHTDCPWPRKRRGAWAIRSHAKTCPWTIRMVMFKNPRADIWYWVHKESLKELES